MKINEAVEIHDTLNPKLWVNKMLKPEVREKLLQITDEFLATSDIKIPIIDARIVGSQASFNYTAKSDIDLHLVTNFELMDASQDILATLYNAIRSNFNRNYDISIRDIPVEVYIEDVKTGANSNGIYSIYLDKWIKYPAKIEAPELPLLDVNVADWKKKINHALESKNAADIESVLDEIYLLRKNAISVDGEFSLGNQVFKELRNAGLIDTLKDNYRKFKSKDLCLEHYRLHEDSRARLLAKSKQSKQGFERFKKRVKSRVANTVKQYNSIDMNKLFKQDIITVDINVRGETDTYTVKISFGGVCELIQDQIKRSGEFNLKAVTRALITGLNRDDVYVRCSCPDASYRYNFWQSKNKVIVGAPETRPSDVTNPNDSLGAGCKHVLLVLSNTSWLLKVASTVYNYVNYMEKHYNKLYADIIYPAIYGKDYEEPIQLDIFDSEDLSTDQDTIDKSNEYAVDKTRFKPGNTQGIRYTASDKDSEQLELDSLEDSENL